MNPCATVHAVKPNELGLDFNFAMLFVTKILPNMYNLRSEE